MVVFGFCYRFTFINGIHLKIEKNNIHVMSNGYYEFYKNEKLRIGVIGPKIIWKKQ